MKTEELRIERLLREMTAHAGNLMAMLDAQKVERAERQGRILGCLDRTEAVLDSLLNPYANVAKPTAPESAK